MWIRGRVKGNEEGGVVGGRSGMRDCKVHDVPQLATSEAEALRRRRSRWTCGERPDRRLLLPFLCARVGIRIPHARRRSLQGPLACPAAVLRIRHKRRSSGLQARAHAERGAHGLVSRADETQLSAHVDALFVRPRIRAREAVDEGEQCGRVVDTAPTTGGKKEKEKGN